MSRAWDCSARNDRGFFLGPEHAAPSTIAAVRLSGDTLEVLRARRGGLTNERSPTACGLMTSGLGATPDYFYVELPLRKPVRAAAAASFRPCAPTSAVLRPLAASSCLQGPPPQRGSYVHTRMAARGHDRASLSYDPITGIRMDASIRHRTMQPRFRRQRARFFGGGVLSHAREWGNPEGPACGSSTLVADRSLMLNSAARSRRNFRIVTFDLRGHGLSE